MDNALLIPIIAASSALGGASIAPIVSVIRDNLERKHEANNVQISKCEELSLHVVEGLELLNSAYLETNEEAIHIYISAIPLQSAKALSQIYFPSLYAGVGNALNSYDTLVKYMFHCKRNTPKVDGLTFAGAARMVDEKIFDKYIENFQASVDVLNSEIRTYCKTLK